ncbi:HEAT repeat domain-containing protein [Halomonas sp. 18H]|nr:HEAT repeat domain-containing protein [Halomonas sp. 18H]MCW4150949.1 HEAT repeat domain-containing protein [Halomonas sp. 18H]
MLTPSPARRLSIGMLWLAAGFGAEAWGAHMWFATASVPSLPIMLLHGAGALLMAEGVRQLLPSGYQQPLMGNLLLLFLLLFLLPGIGLLGLLMAVVPALYGATPKRDVSWQALNLPPLPYQPLSPPSPETTAMREGLASILSYSDSPVLRQEAILACRHLPRRQAINLLRLGLADPTDDVRLLAYSMLSGIERDVDERIQRLVQHRERDGDPHGHFAEALATLHWEYDYLTLAQGSTTRFYLSQALDYINQAIGQANHAHRQLLRGRIYLALKDQQSAEQAFRQCEMLDMHDDDLAPYRAEQAFQTRNYHMLRDHLSRLSPTAQQHPVLHPLMEYWR